MTSNIAANRGVVLRLSTFKNTKARIQAPHAFAGIPCFQGTIDDVVSELKPSIPLYITRPDFLASEVSNFVNAFKGDTVYAVKCNPDKAVLSVMHKAGVKSFDVASLEEMRLVRKIAPKAKLFFMHPIKSPESIREAYFTHGVRAFVIDSKDELYKIMRETELANDLELYVRMSLPKNKKVLIDFSSKFGASPADAAELLKLARTVASRLGLSLHVGTQCTEPQAYKRAIREAASVIKSANVPVEILDIGGGFPVEYPGQDVPPLVDFMNAINDAVKQYKLDKMELMAEPGRALVARSTSLIVRVEGIKDSILFLNDGTYGGLFDAGASVRSRFPVRRITVRDIDTDAEAVPYRFAGPTCDSIDMMEGPFYLPNDIKAGDWIEIGHTGAYSHSMRTNFNGFGGSDKVMLLG
jgi:ornithine decarboxylase